MSDKEFNDLGASSMRDDSITLQDAKVRHSVFGAGSEAIARTDPALGFARTLQEAAVTGKRFVPPDGGMSDEDVRRREHPEEFENG